MSNKPGNKFAHLLSSKGLYIAVTASLLLIAAAVWIAYSTVADKLGADLDNANNSSAVEEGQVNAGKDNIAKETTAEEAVTTRSESAKDAEADAEDVAKETPDSELKNIRQPVIRPHSGEVINVFSNGELVKSKTLNVWKTHDGVDFAGALGDHVKCMTAGTVTQIFEDPMWGVCVVVDHGGGICSHYCGLNKVVTVNVGDSVSAGTVIGAIGDTADCELSENSHLHFAVSKDGEWIDPLNNSQLAAQ